MALGASEVVYSQTIFYTPPPVFTSTYVNAHADINIDPDDVLSMPLLPYESSANFQLYPLPMGREDSKKYTDLFLKLDTRTGQLYLICLNINEPIRTYQKTIYAADLSEGNPQTGRFRLYPTREWSVFILLDQAEGRCWWLLWTRFNRNQILVPIESISLPNDTLVAPDPTDTLITPLTTDTIK